MFESFLKSNSGLNDNSFWGTSQGSQVAQQKLMTNGMTSGGAEAIVKGSIPKSPVDKLKLANAYGGGTGRGNPTGKPDPKEMLKLVGPALRKTTKNVGNLVTLDKNPGPSPFKDTRQREAGLSWGYHNINEADTSVVNKAGRLLGDWFLP